MKYMDGVNLDEFFFDGLKFIEDAEATATEKYMFAVLFAQQRNHAVTNIMLNKIYNKLNEFTDLRTLSKLGDEWNTGNPLRKITDELANMHADLYQLLLEKNRTNDARL